MWVALGVWMPVAAAQPSADEEIAPSHEAAREGEQSRQGATLPLRLTERPLTLPRGKVVVTSRIGVDHHRFDAIDSDCVATLSGLICGLGPSDRRYNLASTSAGFAVGAIDALEIGLVPLRMREGIASDGGREPIVRDPLLYLEAAALRLEHFQLGFGYQIYLPLRSDTTTMTQATTLDLLARSRFVRAEASAFVRFDSPIRERSTISLGERVITPGVAVELTGQVADPFALFLAFQTSFFGGEAQGHSTDIRAGVVGTVRRSTGEPIADFRFTFGRVDVRRWRGGGRIVSRCVTCGDPVVPDMSAPVRLFTFELGAVFYFHDAW